MFHCAPSTCCPQPFYYSTNDKDMPGYPQLTPISRDMSGNNYSNDNDSILEYPQRVSMSHSFFGNPQRTLETTYIPSATLPDSKFQPGYFNDQTNFDYSQSPTLHGQSSTDQHAYASAFVPTSIDPTTALSPWALQAPPQNIDYLSHDPVWPTALPSHKYCPCDQHVPAQLPELGYESASPASDRSTCPRMTVSQSPIIKTEHDEDFGHFDRPRPDEEDADIIDPCYAELLRQCLLKAPDYTMSLRDLYAWVAEHSPKAKDPTSTGWKNSVRHNLSMNQGFEKVPDTSPRPAGSKHRSFWRLTEDAVLCGIQSTTRYRKGDSKRKSQRGHRSGVPDNKRVKSGAKGGQATRRLANRRAMAAARSSYNNSPYPRLHFESRSYPVKDQPFSHVGLPPSNALCSAPDGSTYWDGLSSAQGQVSFTSPPSCKVEDTVDGYLFSSTEAQNWTW